MEVAAALARLSGMRTPPMPFALAAAMCAMRHPWRLGIPAHATLLAELLGNLSRQNSGLGVQRLYRHRPDALPLKRHKANAAGDKKHRRQHYDKQIDFYVARHRGKIMNYEL